MKYYRVEVRQRESLGGFLNFVMPAESEEICDEIISVAYPQCDSFQTVEVCNYPSKGESWVTVIAEEESNGRMWSRNFNMETCTLAQVLSWAKTMTQQPTIELSDLIFAEYTGSSK